MPTVGGATGERQPDSPNTIRHAALPRIVWGKHVIGDWATIGLGPWPSLGAGPGITDGFSGQTDLSKPLTHAGQAPI